MASDFKSKYIEMRNNMISATDLAYRLGYEKGLADAQMANAQQQAADAQAQLQAMQNPQIQIDANGQPIAQNAPQDPSIAPNAPQGGQPGMEAPANEALPMNEGQGTELDGHLNELEGLISKGQKPSLPELREKLNIIQDLRKSQKQKAPPIKQVMSAQKQLLNNILKSWKEESPKLSSSIADIITQAENKAK